MIQMPASTTAAGMCMGAPDACLTPAPPAPPVPIPYPNMAQLPTADSVVTTVLIENRETVTQSSKIPRSNGDEGGVNGGVVSGVFGDQVTFKQASSKVFAAGKKVVMVTAMSAHNGSNANMPAGAQTVPSQAKVMVSL